MAASMITKIRRRVDKSVQQYGVPVTVVRCAFFPVLFCYWKLREATPYERQLFREGEEYDREHNVDTVRTRNNEFSADVDSENWSEGTGYAASPASTVRRAIEMLPIDFSKYVFIDLGSGKARAPLVATEYPFKASIGVEYAPDLHEVAAKNVETYTSSNRKCDDLRVYCHDATTYDLPHDPLVIYFGHPFGGEVLDGLLANLARSLEEAPREVFLIYYDPICIEQWKALGFEEIGSHDLPRIHRFHNTLGKEFIVARRKANQA